MLGFKPGLSDSKACTLFFKTVLKKKKKPSCHVLFEVTVLNKLTEKLGFLYIRMYAFV